MEFSIYLKVEPYLAQWFTHEMGGETPVKLIKGCAESNIIELFLAKRPKNLPLMKPAEANLVIAIPSFKHKDPRVYNYLPQKAEQVLANCIRNRFDVAMWKDLHVLKFDGQLLKDMIGAWMESHGIEDTETNFFAVAKRYQRKQNLYQIHQNRISKKNEKNLST